MIMKSTSKITTLFVGLVTCLTALYSCQKSSLNAANSTTSATIIAAGAIQVSTASTATAASPSTDAVFVIHAYAASATKDSVAFSTLPASVSTYLAANYAGYTVQKSFKISNAGVIDSYIVIINFNGKPVGLKFNSAGVFVQVLEQCEGHDLGGGPGWHEGGRFGDRDGMHHDTVAIAALPAVIKTAFTTTYPKDTLLHAALNFDGTYILISANKGIFATAVSATGTLLNHVQVYPHNDVHTAIAATALPAAVNTYLTTTFPGYVLDKAFTESLNGVVNEYVVFINVNGTRHAVEFDSTGKFVSNVVIR
jgi:hypothetical protein